MIEIISGTNRPGSNALKLAKFVHTLFEAEGTPSAIIDLATLPPETFLPTSYGEKPASFLPFQQRVLNAKGLYVIAPEYNGSAPGVLKYFIDLMKFPESFEHKPVAFMGEAAGIWGGLRAVEHLQQVFGYRNAYVLPERIFIPSVHTKLDEQGRLKDEFILGLLKDQVKKFVTFSSVNK